MRPVEGVQPTTLEILLRTNVQKSLCKDEKQLSKHCISNLPRPVADQHHSKHYATYEVDKERVLGELHRTAMTRYSF